MLGLLTLTLVISHLALLQAGFPKDSEEICSFYVGAEDTPLTSYKFTRIGDTPVNILALGDCELTVVAVGGGGWGATGSGGSGYVVTNSFTVYPFTPSQLVVRVGGPGENSSLQISEGGTIITAQSGGNAHVYNGGAGYSGGGGGNYNYISGGYGGANGGDGQDSAYGDPGGAGSGFDISTISLTKFSLSPGAGGQRGSQYGGGGGGLMVDGAGPQKTVHDGQGYGGGGFNQYVTPGGGRPGPGIVLLEIKIKH